MPAATQTRHWIFTLNNYTNEEDDYLRDELSGQVSYLVYGYEKAPTTGTRHLQGYVVFKTIKRMCEAKALVSARAHLEAKRGTPKEASEYCKKEGLYQEFGTIPQGAEGCTRYDTFVQWVLSRRDAGRSLPSEREVAQAFPSLFLQHSRHLLVLARHLYPEPSLVEDDADLRAWQQVLHDALLRTNPGDRAVLFYVDKDGGAGKSFLQRYMISKYPDKVQVLSSGKRDDVAHAVDASKNIFMFNVPRGGMEYFSYPVVEQLKDRMLFSPKYHSHTKIWMEHTHVVVFCNEEPVLDRMTDDRYVIINLS